MTVTFGASRAARKSAGGWHETGDATASAAANILLNIKSFAETADKNASTALDWALSVINAVNGRIIVGDAAVENVKPAMDKIRTDIAAAQAAVAALEALGVGGGTGTGLTEAQAQMILDNATGVATLRAENAALKARLDALEAKTVNLTNDGKLSTANVLGDGFVDAQGNSFLPDLNQGLRLLVDVLTWGAEGAYGATSNTVETLYEALVAQHGVIETQAEVAEYLLQQDEWVVENLTALVTYIQEQIAEVTAFSQGIIDAINGPNATLQSTQDVFWMLNDVLMALIAATGIELPGKA